MGADLVGRTLLGRFRLTGYIGEGAMAAVYRGEQDQEPAEVAVKVMHRHLASDVTFIKRFEREAKAASRLSHPNTVKIIDFGVDDGLLFMAMELLRGKDLYDTLALERRLPHARSVRIMVETCDALTAAHDLGIVHRDLKPENIMLAQDPERLGRDRVKVLDFGIAKIMEREKNDEDGPPSSMPVSALTTVGVVVGTPAYMSPEQCRGEKIDGRSDIYACGVLLYQLVTGRTPFVGDSPIDLAIAHVRDDPVPPSRHVPGLHAGLEGVILKALAKWPAERQENARVLKNELLKVLAELPDAGPAVVIGNVHDVELRSADTLPAMESDLAILGVEPAKPPAAVPPATVEELPRMLPDLVEPESSTRLPVIFKRDASPVDAPKMAPPTPETAISEAPVTLPAPEAPSLWLLAVAVLIGVVIGVLGFVALR